MDSRLTTEDTDKLLELQEKCDLCKQAIRHEEETGSTLEVHELCDTCKVLRLRVPELMEVKRKLMAANTEE